MKKCKTRLEYFFSYVFIFLLNFISINAQTNYFQSSNGSFSINLPEGWKLSQKKIERVFVFQSPDDVSYLMLQLNEGYNLDEQFEKMIELGQNSLKIPEPDQIKSIIVSGLNGKIAVSKFTILDNESREHPAIAYFGAIEHSEGAMGYFAVLTDDYYKNNPTLIENTFSSIKLNHFNFKKILPFVHNLLELELPINWTINTNLKGLIAGFNGDNCSMNVSGAAGDGFGESKEDIMDDFSSGILNALPDLEVEGDYLTIMTDSNEEILIENLEGAINDKGAFALIATAKNQKRGLAFFAIYYEKEKKDIILSIIRTLK